MSPTTQTAYERILDALRDTVSTVKDNGRQATANCPAHEDRSPSLSVRAIEGQALVHCHAGCRTDDILAALSMSLADLFDEPRGATYRYDDGRVVHRTPDKKFHQTGTTNADRGTHLYRLEKVAEAVRDKTPIYWVEGEKDVHALESIGAVATTAPMGAGNVGKVDATPLAGARVIAVPDQDKAGIRWQQIVLDKLAQVGATVKIGTVRAGKDAADHIAAGHDLDEIALSDPPPGDAEQEAQLVFNREVAEEAHRLEVREVAREIVAAKRLAALNGKPVDAGTLDEILARAQPTTWAIDGILPTGGRLLCSAQRKTGKTILALNYARSRLTGAPLLGKYQNVRVDGRVSFLNYEVTGEQLARWADDIGIPRTRLYLINLRGRRNLLADQDGRAELVDMLQKAETQALAVDPFGRAFTGRSQNDAADVAPWLVRLDQLATDAGAEELVLTAHAGWDGERTRGSSALEDWPDTIVTVVRDPDDKTKRYIRAEGRDVEIEEDELHYDPNTRALSLRGTGSRKHGKEERATEEAMTAILKYLPDNPDVSGEMLKTGVREIGFTGNDKIIVKARARLVERGLVVEAKRAGRGGGWAYHVPSVIRPPNDPQSGNSGKSGTTELPGFGTPVTPYVPNGVPNAGVDDQPQWTPTCPDCGESIDSTFHASTCEQA